MASDSQSDIETLTKLNADYVASVQNNDVARFKEILAEDFMCSNQDGSLIDRDEFLKQVAKPLRIRGLKPDVVKVRVLGDFAIIHAQISYMLDGVKRTGRYTDDWARRDGTWYAVSAHTTADNF